MWYGDSNLDLNTWLQDVQGSDMHILEFQAEWSECCVVKRQAGDLPSFPTPSNLRSWRYYVIKAKSHSTSTQYRQLRRLDFLTLLVLIQ